ncbi:MarR family transcriptional regulator [Natronorubrum sp. DTA28]|uniref:MarR family transcriptional regulator n=1 Tax=Natronorubrum sp. DTA28 TaxID=3447019 RepID=UPI003F8678E1
MNPQQYRPRPTIEPIPDDLESAQAKLVYVYLEATGGATAEELCATLSLQKLSILSILNALSSAGFVERQANEYVVAN